MQYLQEYNESKLREEAELLLFLVTSKMPFLIESISSSIFLVVLEKISSKEQFVNELVVPNPVLNSSSPSTRSKPQNSNPSSVGISSPFFIY